MNHNHRHGRYIHIVAGHCNDRSGRSGNSVNLNSYLSAVFLQHIVDLTCRKTIATRRVDPNNDIAVFRCKFAFEDFGCYIIVKPTFLCDRSVQMKNPLLGFLVFCPVPKLSRLGCFHRGFPPFGFRHYLHRQRLLPDSKGAYCR